MLSLRACSASRRRSTSCCRIWERTTVLSAPSGTLVEFRAKLRSGSVISSPLTTATVCPSGLRLQPVVKTPNTIIATAACLTCPPYLELDNCGHSMRDSAVPAGEEGRVQTVYDWVTVAIFAGL